MIERFETTITCTNEGCDHYMVPVDVDTIRETETGACHLRRDGDWLCECGQQREDWEDARRSFHLHVIEWVPGTLRRRYPEAMAA